MSIAKAWSSTDGQPDQHIPEGDSVNKQDLMAEVRDTTGLSKEQAERAVEAVFGLITEALRRGDEVRTVGFGSFFVGTRAASPARNPRTGEQTGRASCRERVGQTV